MQQLFAIVNFEKQDGKSKKFVIFILDLFDLE